MSLGTLMISRSHVSLGSERKRLGIVTVAQAVSDDYKRAWCVRVRAQSTCELCSSVDMRGNARACSSTQGQAVCASLAFRFQRTSLYLHLCPTATPPRGRWAEQVHYGIWCRPCRDKLGVWNSQLLLLSCPLPLCHDMLASQPRNSSACCREAGVECVSVYYHHTHCDANPCLYTGEAEAWRVGRGLDIPLGPG